MSVKTKNKIMMTLLDLLEDNNINELTVSEIAAHSGIVRKTFYNNFSSKEDVVKYMIDRLIDTYVSQIKREGSFTMESLSKIYFTFISNNKEVFNKLIHSNLFYIYIEQFDKFLYKLFPFSDAYHKIDYKEEHLKYIISFNAYGTNSMVYMWAKSGFKESVEELSDLYHKITNIYT